MDLELATRIMQFPQSNAVELFPDDIPEPTPLAEPEPEDERDSIYYIDTIVFKVCN